MAFSSLAAVLMTLLASSEPPLAQVPEQRLVLNSLTIVRLNPLGLEEQLRFGHQRKLYESDSPVTRDNFVFVGLSPKVNPAYLKVGPTIELQPASVVNLRFTAEYISFFSTFGYLQSTGAPADDYSDSTMATARDAKENYATWGMHLLSELLLQAKVGKLAVRNRFALEYWNMNVRAGDRTWYDATLDTLVPADGWVVADDADLIYQAGGGLNVGLRYSFVEPLYSAPAFRPEDLPLQGNGHHRLGPLVAYTFFDDGYSRFAKPTVLLIANWYLSHRYRTGAEGSRAMPYLVLGFAFQSDFLTPGGLADAR
ncbi:MAG: hypothetical protein ACYC8T_32540 [Myxococcaceae bacterium]